MSTVHEYISQHLLLSRVGRVADGQWITLIFRGKQGSRPLKCSAERERKVLKGIFDLTSLLIRIDPLISQVTT